MGHYTTASNRLLSSVFKLTLFQLVVMVIFPNLIYGRLPYGSYVTEDFSVLSTISICLSVLHGAGGDITTVWYTDIGAIILMNSFFYVVTILIVKFVQLGWNVWYKFYDSKFTNSIYITRTLLQRDLNELHLGPKFLFDGRIASMFTITCVGVIYSANLPVLYVLTCVYCWVYYMVDKSFFLGVYRLPGPSVLTTRYSPILEVPVVLAIAVFLHLLVSIISYSNGYLYAPSISSDLRTVSVGESTFLEIKPTARMQGFTWSRFLRIECLPPAVLLAVVSLTGLALWTKPYFGPVKNCAASLPLLNRSGEINDSGVGVHLHTQHRNKPFISLIPWHTINRRLIERTLKKEILERYCHDLNRKRGMIPQPEPTALSIASGINFPRDQPAEDTEEIGESNGSDFCMHVSRSLQILHVVVLVHLLHLTYHSFLSRYDRVLV